MTKFCCTPFVCVDGFFSDIIGEMAAYRFRYIKLCNYSYQCGRDWGSLSSQNIRDVHTCTGNSEMD